MTRFFVCLTLLLTLGGAGAVPASAPTRILDTAAAQRLRANKGVTLQWIDWNTRGSADVAVADGVWTLGAAQAEAGGPGRQFREGKVTEIGRD